MDTKLQDYSFQTSVSCRQCLALTDSESVP